MSCEGGTRRAAGLAWLAIVVDPVTSQFVITAPSAPLLSREQQKTALLDIMHLHSSMWAPARIKGKGARTLRHLRFSVKCSRYIGSVTPKRKITYYGEKVF